jgi:hypothetical protein
MEKLVYVLQRALQNREGADGSALRAQLIGDVADAIRKSGGSEITVNVHDEHVSQGEGVAMRQRKPPINACVSFWMQSSDDRALAEEALVGASEQAHGYLVVESRPIVHTPPKGERAPGANLVTCITRKPGLEDEVFFDLWNNEHRKVACETQSTTAYVRNAVARPLTAGAPGFDGIVEETFPIEALTDPHVWYDCDDEAEYQARLKRMIASVTAFLDLSVIESVPMSEYYLG